MSDLEICRICLRTGCKMYRYDDTYIYRYNSFKLKGYYEEIMGNKVILPDDLPSCFCYECAALLYKSHKFKIKCYNGQNTLKARLATAGLITYAAIKKINRERINLVNLGVVKATERVRTFIEKDSTCVEINTESLDDGELDKNCDTETLDTELVKGKSDAKMVLLDEDSVEIESKAYDNSNDDTGFEYVFEEDSTADTTNTLCNKQSGVIKYVTNEESKKSFDNVKQTIKRLEDFDEDSTNAEKKRKNSYDDNVNESTTRLKGVKDSNKVKKNRKSGFAKQQNLLDDSLWKIYYLSEEDAWKVFRALAEEPKYVAAEHKCGKCNTWFRTRDKLERHKVLKHGSRGSLECQFCGFRFKHQFHVRKHLQKHYKRFECLKCGMKTCGENSAVFHQDMHLGAGRCCNYCGKSFKHSSTYYTHLRTHRSNFICNICGKSFVSESGLELHKKKTHCTKDGDDERSDDDTSDTYCTKCSIQFESRKAYIEHVFQSAAHDETDESELEPMPDSARKKMLNKTHKEVGASKMKRNVKAALDSFKPKQRLKTKPTKCYQCGQAFETQAACIKHHRKEHPHTPYYDPTERYICDICGANLAKGSILTHQNQHTREKMHTCETCGRSFNQLSALKNHYVTHTGEKKYKCPLCDKRFTQKGSMQLHYKTFHLKQPYPKRNRRPKEPKDAVTAMETASSSTG